MADPETQPQPEEQPKAPVKEKEVLATKVTGTVKWFNVKSGYGFINRHDTKEDVFVHQSAITKNNPRKYVRSVGDGEEVEFDVVVGEKGNEAANVTGPGGEAVKGSPYAHDSDVPMQGSPYAADRRRGYRRRYYRRAAPGEEGEVVEEAGDYVPTMRGRGRGGYRGRGPRRFYRGRYFGRGRGRGAGGRGAFYPGFNDYEGGEVAEVVDGMSMRGRGRGRGRVRGRGGRGPRGYFRRYYGGGAARPQYDQMVTPDDAPRRRFRRAGRGRGRGGRYNGTPETRTSETQTQVAAEGQKPEVSTEDHKEMTVPDGEQHEAQTQVVGEAPQPGQEGQAPAAPQPQQPVENTTAESSA